MNFLKVAASRGFQREDILGCGDLDLSPLREALWGTLKLVASFHYSEGRAGLSVWIRVLSRCGSKRI